MLRSSPSYLRIKGYGLWFRVWNSGFRGSPLGVCGRVASGFRLELFRNCFESLWLQIIPQEGNFLLQPPSRSDAAEGRVFPRRV